MWLPTLWHQRWFWEFLRWDFSTDVLESRLTCSKLDSASKKNSAKCLATSRRIEFLKAHMYARSSGCVYAVKSHCTLHGFMCDRVSRMMLRNYFATCCGAQSRTRSQGTSSASPAHAFMSMSIVSILSKRASSVIQCVGERVTSWRGKSGP